MFITHPIHWDGREAAVVCVFCVGKKAMCGVNMATTWQRQTSGTRQHLAAPAYRSQITVAWHRRKKEAASSEQRLN
jgi:hypothetical protein